MNHDYAHCLDLEVDCPDDCFRAKITRDLILNKSKEYRNISWMYFKGTAECMRGETDEICN